MKAEDVKDRLQEQFAGPNCAVLFEVPDGAGRGRRTARVADAIAVTFWESRGMNVAGYEIKVSRQDWIREVQMPGKANAHFVRCDAWWLVTPERRNSDTPIVKPAEVPGPWGWMEVRAKGESVIRKPAPRLVPSVPFDRAFAFALIKAAARYDADRVKAEVRAAVADRESDFTARVNAQAARIAGGTAAHHVDEPLMAKLRAAFGSDINWLADDRVVEAIAAVRELSKTRRYESFSDTATRLREAADKVEKAGLALEQIKDGG